MNHFKMLIIDDSSYDRYLYRTYLNCYDFEFSELSSGEGIIEFLAEKTPDLIILDWRMPGIDGLETLKMIKYDDRYKEIPVIVITGLEDEEVIKQAFEFGSVDFLEKPINQIELNSRVKKALNLYSIKKELVERKKELEQEIEIASKKQQDYENELEKRKRKMLTLELDSSKRKNQLDILKKDLADMQELVSSEQDYGTLLKKVRRLKQGVEAITAEDDAWEEFKRVFETIHPDFFKKLLRYNSKLTPLDLKHGAFLKMHLTNYEVAQILGIEVRSVEMHKFRLKKKLELSKNDSLGEFIHSV